MFLRTFLTSGLPGVLGPFGHHRQQFSHLHAEVIGDPELKSIAEVGSEYRSRFANLLGIGPPIIKLTQTMNAKTSGNMKRMNAQ
jgi:hypothetical protein